MKNNLSIITLIVITLFLVNACNENQKTEDTKEVAEYQNEEKFDDRAKEKDAQFLVDVAEINLEEIQLGKLAQQKGSMADVKELGKMMENEHTKSMADLTALASKKMVTIPTSLTEDAQNAYDKLNKKSAKDFDKDYCDMMVKGHKDAIDKFEKAATDAEDVEIRAWATATIPTLKTHLDHAIMCQKACDKID